VVDNTVTSSLANVAAPAQADAYTHGLNLFLTGFLVLFFELACIRWFAANVVFLQFFTNVVLLACFLGMSCGCMAALQGRDWLSIDPASPPLSRRWPYPQSWVVERVRH
jgi:uncharacterized membrane protein